MQHRWDGGKMSISNWNVVPTVSVNGIEFGTDRSIVKKALGKPKRVFKKASNSVNTTDAYPDYHVYYSTEDKLEAIEIFGKDIHLSIDSQPIFPGPLSLAQKSFPDLEESYGSYVSKASSVGICVEQDSIVSILLGRKDYYR